MPKPQQRIEAAARKAPKNRKLIPAALAPQKPTLLSFSEKERLKARIRADDMLLRQCRGEAVDGDPEIALGPTQSFAGFNVSNVLGRLKRNKAILERMDPANHRFQGAERQRAEKRMKELEEKLRKNMLSTYDMGYYPKKDSAEKDADYRRACDKSSRQEVGNEEFQRAAQEYKHLARRMDPDNPELANIERLRSKRRY